MNKKYIKQFIPFNWSRKNRTISLLTVIFFALWLFYDLQYKNKYLIAIFLFNAWIMGVAIGKYGKTIQIIIAVLFAIFVSAFAESRLFRVKGDSSLRDYISYGCKYKNSRVLVYTLFSENYGPDIVGYVIHSNINEYKTALNRTLFYKGKLNQVIEKELSSRDKVLFKTMQITSRVNPYPNQRKRHLFIKRFPRMAIPL